MLNLLSLSQLEHKARCDDNALALAIIDKLDDEIEDAKQAYIDSVTPNDGDYSYTIQDAVVATEFLLSSPTWYKSDNNQRIEYLIEGLHEDTSPYNNHLILFREKASDLWTVRVNGGQYGEDVKEHSFPASGFKKAQDAAAHLVVRWISQGLELNI